jgi:hypothetical protein
MGIAEIKEEAIRQFTIKVEAMDNQASLQMVLEYVNSLGNNDNDMINLSQHYESIKLKYGTVLEQLAK